MLLKILLPVIFAQEDLEIVKVKYIILHISIYTVENSDGSDPRISPGSARDRPFLKGSGLNFGEGPKLGIGLGSRSRMEGLEGP